MNKTQQAKDNLNPGSKEAVEKGCKCPVLDNHYGKGVLNGNFWINGECPIHGEPEKKDVWELFDELRLKQATHCEDCEKSIKSFIKTHFIPRAEVVEKIEGMRKPMITTIHLFEAGYNRAVDDLLDLLTQ